MRRILLYVLVLIFLVGSLACQKKVSVSEPPSAPKNQTEELAVLAVTACDPAEKATWQQFGQDVGQLNELCSSSLNNLGEDLKKIKSDELRKLVEKYKMGLKEK